MPVNDYNHFIAVLSTVCVRKPVPSPLCLKIDAVIRPHNVQIRMIFLILWGGIEGSCTSIPLFNLSKQRSPVTYEFSMDTNVKTENIMVVICIAHHLLPTLRSSGHFVLLRSQLSRGWPFIELTVFLHQVLVEPQ